MANTVIIDQSDNKVVATTSNLNNSVVVNIDDPQSVTISENVSSLLYVYSPGPQGPQGLPATASQTEGYATTGSNTFLGDQIITGSLKISGSVTTDGYYIVSSSNVVFIETITSSSYASITPVSGTLYIIIG